MNRIVLVCMLAVAALSMATGPALAAAHSQSHSKLKVKAWVTPKTVKYKHDGTLWGQTKVGAHCTAGITYKRSHTAFGALVATKKGGKVSWTWKELTKAKTTGVAKITCQLKKSKGSGTVTFKVEP